MPRLEDGEYYEVVEIPQDKVKGVAELLGCDKRNAIQIVASTMHGLIYNNRPDIAPCGYYRKVNNEIKDCGTCEYEPAFYRSEDQCVAHDFTCKGCTGDKCLTFTGYCERKKEQIWCPSFDYVGEVSGIITDCPAWQGRME